MHPPLTTQARETAQALTPDVHRYDAGGAGQQLSHEEAEQSWQQLRLRPRVLRDVSTVTTAVELLGTLLRTPVLCGPTAAHGLAHPDGEWATARGVAEAGSLMVLSSRSSPPSSHTAWGWPAAPPWRGRPDLLHRP